MKARSAWGMGLLWLLACGEAAVERSTGPENEPEPSVAQLAAIPESPARGTVQGRTFALQRASLNEGVLKLRQGESFFADLEVTLFLFPEEKHILPEGQSWNVDCSGGWEVRTPHVHVAWREGGEEFPTYDSVMCGYRLRLAFGEETAGRIPGRISLQVPSLETAIAGTFEAEVAGLPSS